MPAPFGGDTDETLPGDPPHERCLPQLNWTDANAECVRYGARLCTREELFVTIGTGCGFDLEYIWVWEPCDHSTGGRHVTAWADNSRNYYCENDASLLHVRCESRSERSSIEANK